MTHSLKVGQVARRLAQHLLRPKSGNETGIAAAGGLDPNVAEAAGRGHDLGHPPYGHIGERELDEIARRHGLRDGFEGNAQTLRVIATLGYHKPVQAPGHARTLSERVALTLKSERGLDLTAAVTAACVKYPWPREAGGKEWYKYGFYEVDAKFFDEIVRPLLPPSGGATLEAQVMDWADDITYAVHDVEDFFLAGLIPLERLAHVPVPRGRAKYAPLHPVDFDQFWTYAKFKLQQVERPVPSKARFGKYASLFPRWPFDNSSVMMSAMGSLASQIITDATNATWVRRDGVLRVRDSMQPIVNVLKELTWYYVIDHPDLASRQHGQRMRLRAVTEQLISWSKRRLDQRKREPWPKGKSTNRSQEEQDIRARVLPVQLREKLSAMASASAESYEKTNMNIVRSVIDYVASLRESEIEALHDALGPWQEYPPSRSRGGTGKKAPIVRKRAPTGRS